MTRTSKLDQEWFTKFGTVNLGFRTDDSTGMLPGWSIPMAIVENQIPGSAYVDVQMMGNGMATAAWRFGVATVADLQALYLLLGTQQDLVVKARTQILTGTQVTYRGVPYVKLANTLLQSIDDVQIEPGGYCEAVATFRRTVNLATLNEAA